MIRLDRATKLLQVDGASKTVIKDVSFTIPRGRSVGVLGRDRVSKSTLLRTIAGILSLDRGRIIREGKVSWPLGYAGGFQSAVSGEQNVRFFARVHGMDTEELVDYVTDFSELGKSLQAPLKTYSSSMKARLAFGISMGVKFDYYIVDGVTAVGDVDFKRKSKRVFQEKLSEADVIMVTHNLSTLRSYCESGIVLEGGKLTFFDRLEDAILVHERNLKGR